MNSTLPPRPDFTQLRHQAKDLLRAHQRQDASCCPVLRRLRRFAPADDADILAQPLALHEAQYALAMEYGFSSWNALKRYVEKVTGQPSPVRREKDRTYVTGLEKYPVGCKDAHDCSIIACIAGAMAALGEVELTYPYLMGVSGAAFRVQMGYPRWCPSAACADCGYDCTPGAMKATGFRLTSIPVVDDPDHLEQAAARAAEAVRQSVDRGIPLLYISEESGLAVGYRNDGKRIVRPYEAPDTTDYVETEDWPWVLGVIEPEDEPMDRRQAVADSLRLAVRLARTERFGDYVSGFAALEHWSEALLDDGRFAELTPENWWPIAHGNGWCYPSLWSARYNAARYLREVADEWDDPARSKLLELAGVYQRMHQTLSRTQPEFDCIWSLQPWMLKSPANWTRAIREKESALLREALAIEREAVTKIEAMLPLLEPSPQA